MKCIEANCWNAKAFLFLKKKVNNGHYYPDVLIIVKWDDNFAIRVFQVPGLALL